MIETIPMYVVRCDGGCGKTAQDGTDYAGWVQAEGALADAVEADWLITDDGKHYCNDCQVYDEDKDEYVAKEGGVCE